MVQWLQTIEARVWCRKTVDKHLARFGENRLFLWMLNENTEFEQILGYINTAVESQKNRWRRCQVTGTKNNETDQIWWKDTPDSVGEWLFSFDKKQVFNMFADYPHNLTPLNRKNIWWRKPWMVRSSSKIEDRKYGRNNRAFSYTFNKLIHGL